MKTNFLNSLASGIIISTLIFTPSIFAKSNSEVNPKIEQLKKVLNQGQYETAKSYAEVWNNIKNLVPPEHKEGTGNIFAYLNQGNFPKMKFQEFTYKGKTAIKSVVQLGGEQVVFEYLLNGNEFMKVNGILLTENDMQSTSAVYAKIGHLSFLKKDYQAYKKAVFAKSFIPDLKTWNRLTKKEKATYLLRYRELLEASKKVFNHYPDKIVASRSPASESFVKAFLGEDSFAEEKEFTAELAAETKRVQELRNAQEAAKEAAASVRNKASLFLGKGKADPNDKRRRAPSCIIAGYAMEWEGNNCKWKPDKQAIFQSPESKKCQSMNNNDSTYIACQPIVYHTESGDPVCIKADAKLTSFQQATHPNGPCEKDSKLESADDKKKFIDGWLKKMEETGKIKQDKYKGLIQVEGDKVVTRNTELFDKITNELIQPLNEYITSAENICLQDDSNENKYKYKHTDRPNYNKNEKKKDPAYQDKACDGLLKRALAVQHLLTPSSSQGEVIAIDACKDWSPPEGVEKDSSKNTCKCKSGYTLDTKIKNTCRLKELPVVTIPPATAVTTVNAGNEPPPPPSDDCKFYQTADDTNGSCSVSPLFKWGGLALGAIGACFLFKLDLCVKDKKKPIPTPAPEYKDPVPPPVDPGSPTVVTTPPATPILPTVPPRNEPASETQADPSVPKGNGSSVPPAIR